MENPEMTQTITFIRKATSKEGSDVNGTIHDGTTNEEVLAVLIDRLQLLNEKLPSKENAMVITKLEESLMWLKKRTERIIDEKAKADKIKEDERNSEVEAEAPAEAETVVE